MLFCSEQYAAILEMSAEEALRHFVTKETIRNLIHPDDRNRYIEAVDSAIPGEGLKIEYKIITQNGTVKQISHVGMTVFDENKKSMGVFVTSQDVSEIHQQREKSEQALLLSRHAERLAHIGFYEWDHQRDCLISCSDEYARIHDMAPDEAMKVYTNSEIDLVDVHPDDRERYVYESEQAVSSRRSLDIQFRLVSSKGIIRHVREMNEFVLDNEGKVLRSYGALQDLTEHVALQEQLRQSQKLEVVGQLTGGIAHDFNNLIAVILGNAELMQQSPGSDAKSDPKLVAILSAAERASELTQHLLSFSRKQALNPRPLQLNDHLDGMLELLKRTLGERIRLDIDHAKNLWLCYSDPAQTENALLNLAVNARDAMSAEGTITVRTENVSLNSSHPLVPGELSEGRYVILSVIDDGVGMSEDVRFRALEPFFTTKEIGKGSGLGLSMVYGFAKQSSGHLLIDSNKDQGCCISIYLPVFLGSMDKVESISHSESMHLQTGSGTVLLVEDDENMLQLVKKFMVELGYTVHQAQDSSTALEAIDEIGHLDLLLTDVVIPGQMNGHELAKRAIQLKPEAKILYMSGYMESHIFEGANMELGVNFLKKPFRKAELAEIVHRVLGVEDSELI